MPLHTYLLTIPRLGKLDSAPQIAGDYSRPPVEDFGGDWSRNQVERRYSRFSAVRAWKDANTAAAWYGDFAHRLREEDEYERLGMSIDALRLISLGRVESTFVEVWEEKGEREQSVPLGPPRPSIFA